MLAQSIPPLAATFARGRALVVVSQRILISSNCGTPVSSPAFKRRMRLTISSVRSILSCAGPQVRR
jgi:hypothetical protein